MDSEDKATVEHLEDLVATGASLLRAQLERTKKTRQELERNMVRLKVLRTRWEWDTERLTALISKNL